jgi:hypothetical protein
VPGGDVVPARQAGAAARRGGVLRNEHGMPAVGRLTAVVARFGRGQPASDQFLGVSADGRDTAQVDYRAVPAAQPELSLGSGAARSGAAWRPTRPSPCPTPAPGPAFPAITRGAPPAVTGPLASGL